jgi:hypothetical protein
MVVSALWPLTLLPLHWINFRVLRWKKWGYAALLFLGSISLTLVVLVAREGS